jgi:hypothetical protein
MHLLCSEVHTVVVRGQVGVQAWNEFFPSIQAGMEEAEAVCFIGNGEFACHRGDNGGFARGKSSSTVTLLREVVFSKFHEFTMKWALLRDFGPGHEITIHFKPPVCFTFLQWLNVAHFCFLSSLGSCMRNLLQYPHAPSANSQPCPKASDNPHGWAAFDCGWRGVLSW